MSNQTNWLGHLRQVVTFLHHEPHPKIPVTHDSLSDANFLYASITSTGRYGIRREAVEPLYKLSRDIFLSALPYRRGTTFRELYDAISQTIARLAISFTRLKMGLGRALFRNSALRVTQAADRIGIWGTLVHAISDEAKAFCLALGFDPSPLEPLTLMVRLADLRAAAAT